MRFLSEKMKFLALWILLVGLVSSVLAQGNVRRVLRVRKTGEFGRRIVEPLSTFYQPPTRHFKINEQTFQVAETRRSDTFAGIKKPSQTFELPLYTQPDQEAEETGESPQGYAYPNPKPLKGVFNDNTQPPISEYPDNDPDTEQQIYEPDPNPVYPEKEAEDTVPLVSMPFGAEREIEIAAQEQQQPQTPPPRPVHDTPVAEQSAQCDEHDHDCWPGGYAGVIPGEAGTDYPILSEIINTSFDCENVPYSGYYADADPQTRCQVFHVCLKGNQYRKTQKWSFLCPNGTVFSQNDFVCVWWNNAPECNGENVNELALRNAELGWDNLTESASGSSNFDVRSAMSSLFNANLQQSGSNSRLKNTLPEQSRATTRRPSSTSTRSSNPYRIPVKVNTGSGARTKLKEIPNNALPLHGDEEYRGEHDGEESETYETSLRHQSEARHKTKTASALSKSESEAYEQKSVPDSVAPFISNRQPVDTTGLDNSNYNVPLQGEYEDEEKVSSVVMMPTQQRNPDGSDGYAEVPVMMTGNGYRYPNPNPTSTPGPQYLPPQNEYASPSTTETPTSTAQAPITEEAYEADGGYQYQTTEQPAQPSYSPQRVEATTEQSGYNYPNPTTTEEAGYTYPNPTTEEPGYTYPSPSTTEQSGYNYPAPTTTEQSGYTYRAPTTTEQTLAPTTTKATYQEDYSSPVYEESEGGYEYESTAAPQKVQPTTTPTVTTTTLASTTSQEPSDGYLPPKTEGGYDSPKASAALQAAADVLTLPNNDSSDDAELGLPLSVTTSPDLSDYTDGPEDLSTVDGNEVTDGESTAPYHLPTPASSPAETKAGDNLDSQDKVNRILKEIQEGGAEVRDESGRKIDFAELQKLILSTPNGLLALQKADEATTPDSAASSSTEVPTTTVAESSPPSEAEEVVTTSEEPKGPVYETVQPIEDYPGNRVATVPYTPETNYFSGARVEGIDRPNFKISAPSREYENHSIEQNSIDSGLQGQQQQRGSSTFSGYSSQATYQSQPQPQANYQRPESQSQYTQNFVSNQQTSNNQLFYQPQSQQQQPQTFRVQQAQAPEPEVNYVRPSVPQPERYYQQSQQQQSNTQSQQSSYYQHQQQEQQSQSQVSQPFRQSNSQSETFYQTQAPSVQPVQQQSYFQQQRQPEPVQVQNQYLPPQPSTSQSQIYQPTPTQSRSIVSPPRDLTNNIQLQQSYNVPLPQASSNNQKLVNPVDIKIVPALFVHQHTRVEEPHGSQLAAQASHTSNTYQRPNIQQRSQSSNRNNNLNHNRNGQFRQFSVQPSNNAFLPYASNTDNVPVTVRAPRFDTFSSSDALPQYEPFTADDGRSAEQIQQFHHSDLRKFQRRNNIVRPTQTYSNPTSASTTVTTTTTRHPVANARRNGRHYIGSSGSRGQLGLLPNEEQSSISNYYPGRDGSLGVSLTYN